MKIFLSYELFNDVIVWGLVNCPDLRYFLWKKQKFIVQKFV